MQAVATKRCDLLMIIQFLSLGGILGGIGIVLTATGVGAVPGLMLKIFGSALTLSGAIGGFFGEDSGDILKESIQSLEKLR